MRPRSGCTNGGSSLSEDGRSFGSFSKNISNQQTPWVFPLQKKCSDLVKAFSGNMHLKVAVSLSIKEHPSTGLETLGLELNEGSQAQKTLYRTCEINLLVLNWNLGFCSKFAETWTFVRKTRLSEQNLVKWCFLAIYQGILPYFAIKQALQNNGSIRVNLECAFLNFKKCRRVQRVFSNITRMWNDFQRVLEYLGKII